MSHLRITFGDCEIERRDLEQRLVIGRSPECEVGVRDVLLSRRHCRIEPDEADQGSWRAIDLASKNGTRLNGRPLAGPVTLRDGDELILGHVTVKFAAGTLAESGLTPLRAAPLRPADPTEALSATFAGFAYLEPGEGADCANLPRPRPSPRPPAALDREDIYSLLTAIASSSWDSIYEEARRPLASAEAAAESGVYRAPIRQRPRSPIDLSLQVCHRAERARMRRHPRLRRLAASNAPALVLAAIVALKLCFDPHVGAMPPAAQAAPIAQAASIAIAPTPADVIVRTAATLLPLLP